MKFSTSFIPHFWLVILGVLVVSDKAYTQEMEDSITFSIDIEDIVITGQYAPTHYKKAIHKVQVLDNTSIEKMGRTQLQEVLTTLPNVRLTYDPILGTSISLRGIASDNINVLVDGIPIIGRLDGALDISQINLTDIERIEIIEGPLSTLYGNNAAGGVINIITKKSQVDDVSISLDGQYESPGIQNYSGRVGFQKKKFSIASSATYLKHQIYPLDSTRIFETIQLDSNKTFLIKKYPWNPKERTNYSTLSRYQFNEDHSLSVKWDLSNETVQNLGAIKRPQFLPYATDNKYRTRRNDQTILYNGVVNNTYYINASLANNSFDRQVEYNRFEFDPDTINTQLSTVDSLTFTSRFAKLDFSTNLDGRINFLAGINYINEIGKGDRLLDVNREDSTTVSIRDIAFFGSTKIKVLEDLELSFSARMAYNSNYETPFIPALQLLYNLSEDWTIRAGYAHGFRAPSLKELYLNFIDTQHFVLGNPSLQPEGSRDWSISSMYQFDVSGWNTTVDVSGYYNRIFDKIILVEYEFFKFNYDNIEEFSTKGINTSVVAGRGGVQFSSSMGLGYRSNNLDSLDKNSVVLDFQNAVSYTLPYKISCNLQHRYVGATPKFQLQGEDIVQNTTAAYNLVDISMNRSFLKNQLRLTVGSKNLLNVQRVDIEGQSLNTGMHITSSPVQLVNQGRTIFGKISINIGR